MNLIVLLVFLATPGKVYNLDCYSSYHDTLTIINCENQVQNKSVISELRCYTITFTKLNESGYKNEVDFRHCSPKNKCKFLTEDIARKRLHIISKIKCVECEGDLCNVKIPDLVVDNSTSFKRNLYIGATACGVIGILGTLLHCLCCLKIEE